MPFSAVPRKQLVDHVIEQLQQQLSLGELQPGAKLPPEPELMAQLGVGRSTLREAVRVLAHAGLLDVRQGDGTYVRAAPAGEPLDRRLRRAHVLEVYEVRHALEIEAARLAAERRDDADLAALRRSLDRRAAAVAAGDQAAFLDADLDFHTRVAIATKNGVLADLYRIFARANREAWRDIITDPAPRADTAALHTQLYQAIARRDPREAMRVTAEHIDGTTEHLRRLLAETP